MSLTILDDVTTEETRSPTVYASGVDVVTSTTYGASPVSAAVTAALSGMGVSPYAGAGSLTQYAERTNFVSSTNQVTDYFLGDSSGHALSAEATNIFVGNNEVFLYSTADQNIVVGLIGNGTTANATGAVAMVFALDETKSGGFVTNANLWIGLYAPLVENGHNLEGSADELNLAGLVSLASNYSTTTLVPFNDFSHVPSGNDAFALIAPSDNSVGADLLVTGFAGSTEGTVNVSTTGLGANAQTVDNGASLRIDVVNANAADLAKADTSPEVHDPSNISYQNHVEAIAAGFELTQNNPTGKGASFTISAYQVSTNSTGTSFPANAFSDGTLVAIDPSHVVIHDNNGNDVTATFGGTITQAADGKSVLITGVPGLDHVDFTATSQFDRFIVTNTMTSATDKTTFDVGAIHVTKVIGGSATEFADLGSHTIFEDDGPVIAASGAAVPTLTVFDATLGVDAHASFAGLFTAPDYGADGPGSLTYQLGVLGNGANVPSGLFDTATGQSIVLNYNSGTNTVIGTTAISGDTVFTISVDGSGNVNLDQARAIKHPDTTNPHDTVSLSAANLVTLTAIVTDGEATGHNDSASASDNIGSSFVFTDDGPTMIPQPVGSATPNDLVLGNVTSGATSADSSSYGLAPGGDGLGSYTIVGPPDSSGDFQWTYNDASHTSITETYKGANLFTLTLNPATGAYTAQMVGTIPSTQLPLDANNIKAGGPTGSIDVGTLGGSGDFVQITGSATSGSSAVNASNSNVGVGNGNLDPGEGLTFTLFTAAAALIPFHGINIGTKTAQSATYHVTGVDDATHAVVDLGAFVEPKNGVIQVNAGNELLDSITVTETSGSAIKIGLAGISLLIPPGDFALGFGAQLTDGDGDSTKQNFTLSIDGNNDGVITNPIVGAAAILQTATVTNTSGLAASTVSTPSNIAHWESAPLMDEAFHQLIQAQHYDYFHA